MDDQNWENETYVPGMLSMRSAWQGDEGDDNVKENWFEDEDEEEPQKAPVAPSQPKKDSKHSKLEASATAEKAEKNNEGYAEFIDQLFHDLCASMSSETVRKIARNLNSLSNEISKIEKEKHKPKAKKKNTIAKLSRGGDFIDELKAGMEDAYDYYDDEDFM
ncbi:hypothetical protein M514_13240 [Trichuris suis]|uniref:Uncharacterized protein n=1 Tax=Trichuris suis TaxID=68888 RepID=A0A085N545_9BILA|nr:hypothetical protein M514_13240 [Trichuris suis]